VDKGAGEDESTNWNLKSTEPRCPPGKARREKKKEKTAKKTAIRVVVLPIFWEERTEEMQVRS
jgi:hypothetical protein